MFARGKEAASGDKLHNLDLNDVDLQRPNKPEMEDLKCAAEEMQVMR